MSAVDPLGEDLGRGVDVSAGERATAFDRGCMKDVDVGGERDVAPIAVLEIRVFDGGQNVGLRAAVAFAVEGERIGMEGVPFGETIGARDQNVACEANLVHPREVGIAVAAGQDLDVLDVEPRHIRGLATRDRAHVALDELHAFVFGRLSHVVEVAA